MTFINAAVHFGSGRIILRSTKGAYIKLVYAVSERGKSKRPAARQIDDGDGRHFCGGKGREPIFWAPEEGEPACKICMDLAVMGHREQTQHGTDI